MTDQPAADPSLCECCGQPMPPPRKPTTFLATHRADTEGAPPAYGLKAEHVLALAEQRWQAGGVQTNLWALDRKTERWAFWRTYPG